MTVTWKLKEFLEARGLSVYTLARAMGGPSHEVKLYRITSPNPDRRPRQASFATLESIARGLQTLTGDTVSVCDLLDFTPAAAKSNRNRLGADERPHP